MYFAFTVLSISVIYILTYERNLCSWSRQLMLWVGQPKNAARHTRHRGLTCQIYSAVHMINLDLILCHCTEMNSLLNWFSSKKVYTEMLPLTFICRVVVWFHERLELCYCIPLKGLKNDGTRTTPVATVLFQQASSRMQQKAVMRDEVLIFQSQLLGTACKKSQSKCNIKEERGKLFDHLDKSVIFKGRRWFHTSNECCQGKTLHTCSFHPYKEDGLYTYSISRSFPVFITT